MIRSALRVAAAMVAAASVLLVACTASGNPAGPSTGRPTPPSSPSPRATDTFHATGAQVAEVLYLERFINAYNAGDVRDALAQFSRTKPVGFSDCDYARQQLVVGHGRAQLTDWLQTNMAQHDRLTIGNVFDANPDQPVLGVSFSRRRSDSIAGAGHPNGIAPALAAKVKFDPTGLITEFNNGPLGGPADGCSVDLRSELSSKPQPSSERSSDGSFR